MKASAQQTGISRGIWILASAGLFSLFLVPFDGQGIIPVLLAWLLFFSARGYRKGRHFAGFAVGLLASLFAIAFVASVVFGAWLGLLGLVPLFSLGHWTELWLFLSLVGITTLFHDQGGPSLPSFVRRQPAVLAICAVILFAALVSVIVGQIVRVKANTRLTQSSTLESPSGRMAIQVPLDKMILLDIAGKAKLLIDFTDLKEHQADYRWRLKPAQIEETSGTGRVAEHVAKFGCLGIVYPEKSQTVIRAGSVGVHWSYCSSTSTWIYYHPNKTTVRLLPNDEFSEFLID